MSKPMRPSANKTRAKILKAAKKVFLAKGFDAAFIKEIAQEANVNTNLIFHHFINKAMLWQKVKAAILEQGCDTLVCDDSSAQSFFKSLLDYRFALYSQYPDLVKLLQWQQLTENESALAGIENNTPNHWLDKIRYFQAQGEVINHITAEQILLFIVFSSHAPFLQKIIPLSEQEKIQYKNMVYRMCQDQFVLSKSPT